MAGREGDVADGSICHRCLAPEGEPYDIAGLVVGKFDAVDLNFFSDLRSRLLRPKD
jgi:hypothetical protein